MLEWLLQLWQHAVLQLPGVTGSGAEHHVGLMHRVVLLPPCVLLHQQESLQQLEDGAESQSLAVSLPPPVVIKVCYNHSFIYECGKTKQSSLKQSHCTNPITRTMFRCVQNNGRMITDEGKSKYSEKNLLQLHLGDNKSRKVVAKWLALLLPI
jgi:hypothetical protein